MGSAGIEEEGQGAGGEGATALGEETNEKRNEREKQTRKEKDSGKSPTEMKHHKHPKCL